MTSLIRTILYLVITTLLLIIFNEGIYITSTQGTLLSGIVTLVSFIIYGPVCYIIARKFEFGRWKYVFFIPFINEMMYLFLGLYILNIRKHFPWEDDNFGLGVILLPLTFVMWVIFFASTFVGIDANQEAKKVRII